MIIFLILKALLYAFLPLTVIISFTVALYKRKKAKRIIGKEASSITSNKTCENKQQKNKEKSKAKSRQKTNETVKTKKPEKVTIKNQYVIKVHSDKKKDEKNKDDGLLQ